MSYGSVLLTAFCRRADLAFFEGIHSEGSSGEVPDQVDDFNFSAACSEDADPRDETMHGLGIM